MRAHQQSRVNDNAQHKHTEKNFIQYRKLGENRRKRRLTAYRNQSYNPHSEIFQIPLITANNSRQLHRLWFLEYRKYFDV